MAKVKAKKKTKGQLHRKFVRGQSDKSVTSNKGFVFVYKNEVTMAHIEPDEEFMRRHGVFEKLLAQTKHSKPSTNWKAELDEL